MPIALSSPGLRSFKQNRDICWWPLVVVRVADTHDECDNPRCLNRVELKQAHMVNGAIVVVRMCWDCGEQVASAAGMGELPSRALAQARVNP